MANKSKMRTFKEIREDIEALEPVTNKETFLAAIPLLVEMSIKLKKMSGTMDTCRDIAAALNDSCSAYALKHESVFVDGLVEDGKGVRTGDVGIDGLDYHFSAGFDGYCRDGIGKLTQPFLSTLPKGWTKKTTRLDATAIKELGVTEDALKASGLKRKPNNVWSLSKVEDTSVE